jgi:Peptidase A4 family
MAAGVIAASASLAGSASAATPPGDWYGYAVTGATYTSTTAAWTMPVVSCTTSGTYIAIWTGLDGYSSPTVEQIGAEAYCSGSTPAYFGWYELYPGAPVDFSKPLKPGDVTQGWTQTVTKALSGAARSSAETVVQVPATFTCTAPLTLADFTGDTVDGSPLGGLHPVKVTGGDPHIVVSGVSGGSFTVSCRPGLG